MLGRFPKGCVVEEIERMGESERVIDHEGGLMEVRRGRLRFDET